MATPYVCTLDEVTLSKARNELYEDPNNRQGAIEAFRDWIKQQKHIRCPTGRIIFYFDGFLFVLGLASPWPNL